MRAVAGIEVVTGPVRRCARARRTGGTDRRGRRGCSRCSCAAGRSPGGSSATAPRRWRAAAVSGGPVSIRHRRRRCRPGSGWAAPASRRPRPAPPCAWPRAWPAAPDRRGSGRPRARRHRDRPDGRRGRARGPRPRWRRCRHSCDRPRRRRGDPRTRARPACQRYGFRDRRSSPPDGRARRSRSWSVSTARAPPHTSAGASSATPSPPTRRRGLRRKLPCAACADGNAAAQSRRIRWWPPEWS